VIVVVEAVGSATAAAGGSGLDLLLPLDGSCFFGLRLIPADCSAGAIFFLRMIVKNPTVLLLLLLSS
jgi:hypothetical protein